MEQLWRVRAWSLLLRGSSAYVSGAPGRARGVAVAKSVAAARTLLLRLDEEQVTVSGNVGLGGRMGPAVLRPLSS